MSSLTERVFKRAATSLRWTALTEVCSRAITPLIVVVLARLLAPTEFGLVAISTIAITFIQTLWDGGLGRALVQLDRDPGGAANVVFWTNLALGLASFGLLASNSGRIAIWLGSPQAGPILQVLSLQTIIGALGSVQQAMCVRNLEFRRLFWVRLCAVAGPGTLSVPFAMAGHGAWALVIGSLCGQASSVALLWWLSPWRPSWQYDWSMARRLFGFGSWVVLEGIAVWLIVWGDNFVVGRLLGAHDLGVYRTGSSLVLVAFSTLLSPVAAVAYPVFARMQSSAEELRHAFQRVTEMVVALTIALGVGLALLGPELAAAFFGEKWEGMGWVISMFALTQSAGWIVALNAELYRAIGRPDINTKVTALALVVYMPAFWIGASHGLATFCVVRFAVAAAALPLHLWLGARLIGLPMSAIWTTGKPCYIAATAMVVAVLSIKQGSASLGVWYSLGLQTAIGVVFFVAVLWIVDRKFFLRARMLLSKARE